MCIDSYADISIHTPTRGTTAGTGTATNLAEFQSTFPREERPYYTIVRIQVLQFQSTLPREERPFPTDFVTAFMPYFNPRSHERSDYYYHSNFRLKINFNPRSHERSDAGLQHNSHKFHPFQSTLPREERPISCVSTKSSRVISIHAPTRGATPIVYHFLFIYVFQSTLPREERHIIPINGAFVSYFNPRSHERSDQ